MYNFQPVQTDLHTLRLFILVNIHEHYPQVTTPLAPCLPFLIWHGSWVWGFPRGGDNS